MAVISIHAAREGGDKFPFLHRSKQKLFQSTPPVKAATQPRIWYNTAIKYFNPRRP